MAQETDIGKSWEEIVRAYAKAERELGVKVYCVLRICKKVNGEEIVLHRYDMPREILQRWRWVINWRMAKLRVKTRERISMKHYLFTIKQAEKHTVIIPIYQD